MRRRFGVGLCLVVLVVAVVAWRRCGGARERGASSPSTTASKPVGKERPVAARARDAKVPTTSSLAGTVSDDKTHAPIAGARVCGDAESDALGDELTRDPYCADTDASGRYLISNLPPAKYSVGASAPTYIPANHAPGGNTRERRFVLAAAEHRTGVDIALRPGGVEITGTVSDLTGGPISHAWVHSGAGQEGAGTTVTDDRGRFSLWVAPGQVSLIAWADGYGDVRKSGRAPGAFELLLTPEASLGGTVLDAAGEPVEGARVAIASADMMTEGGGSSAVAFSGSGGAFRAGGLAPGRYAVAATTEHGAGHADGSQLVGLGQHVDGLVIKLRPAVRVEGKVLVAATQQPCADASVELRDAPHDRDVWMRKVAGDAVVAGGVLPGTYTPTVRCRDFAPRDSYPLVAIADKDVTSLVWEVDAGATLRGKVSMKSGEPVEGVQVMASGGLDRRGFGGMALSERDGSYELRGLRPGSYQLRVMANRGVAPVDGLEVDVAAGAVVERNLVLDGGGTLAGTVVDAEGAPVGGMYIQMLGRNPRFQECRADASGAFRCDSIDAGEYHVNAIPSRFAPFSGSDEGQAVTVRTGEVSTVKLVVPARTGSIRGSVVDGAGKPVSDAFVAAAHEAESAGPGRNMTMMQLRWTFDELPNLTASDGTFTVPRLAPGNYTVRAFRRGGGEAIAEHVAVGSTVTVQIKPTGSIEGMAHWSGDATAAVSVTVTNKETEYTRTEQFAETGGHYVMRDLPSGHLTVTVETDGRRKQLEVDLADGEHKTGLDATLEELVTVTGRIVEKGSTTPVAGVSVMAMIAGEMRMSRSAFNNMATSDPQGRFTIRNVPRGKMAIMGMLRGRAGAYGMLHVERTIEGSGTVDVGDIELEKRPK